MPTKKRPTKPALWEAAKKKQRNTTHGSPKGRWSARKAVLARKEYERQGGSFR